MLILDFLNVGDGDAVLIRESTAGFVMLVDTGRPHVEFTRGSKRNSVLNHLMRERIDHIDLLVLTHLHFDHIGGALSVFRHIPVRKLVCAYLPPENTGWIYAPDTDEKTIIGMIDALNYYSDIISAARLAGTQCERAIQRQVFLSPMLMMHLIPPDDILITRQKNLFDALYLGENIEEPSLYAVSKERNISSLREKLVYAGKSILLTGDSYAEYLEQDIYQPCDVLKVPHHGDNKSMTEMLLRRLRPEYAVISCENSKSSIKERPSPHILSMLLRQVPQVFCTENRTFDNYPAASYTSIRLEIDPAGCMTHSLI